MKKFCFSKNTLSSSYFLIFLTFKVFWLFAKKTSWLGWKWHFKENIPFDTHSTANLPPLGILKEFKFFFEKNHLFFQKRPKFWTFWGILLFQAHSTANLLQFGGQKNFTVSIVNVLADVAWRQLAHIWWKKLRKWPIRVEDFAFISLRIWCKKLRGAAALRYYPSIKS